jgi:hypothetical protein
VTPPLRPSRRRPAARRRTIDELPTAAIFFDENIGSIGRVGCERELL